MVTQNKGYRQFLLKIVLILLLAVAANSEILKAQEHTMIANIRILGYIVAFSKSNRSSE